MIWPVSAAVLAFILMLILMPGCIRKLKKLKFGQTMYELGPQTHLSKQGTPNMGGIVTGAVTLTCTAACFILWRFAGKADPLFHVPFWSLRNALWALLFLTAACMMAVGFADDYIKDVKKDHEGLKPRNTCGRDKRRTVSPCRKKGTGATMRLFLFFGIFRIA